MFRKAQSSKTEPGRNRNCEQPNYKLQIEAVIEKFPKAKSWFFERINNIDKPLARLIKKQRKIKSTKLEMKKERLQ